MFSNVLIFEFYFAIFIAKRQPVATGRFWLLPVIRQFQKAYLNTGHSELKYL